MVAGEYAVLDPNQSLVVTAVDRFIYVEIKKSERNSLTLANYELHNISFDFIKGNISLDIEDERTSFVRSAMNVIYNYLQEQGIATFPVALKVNSELDDKDGIKYGLGSSAAVVTGVVTALLTMFLKKTPEKQLIFKLAAIAHVNIQGSGSGADIAASTYGGMLKYTSFQAEWLLKEMEQTDSVTTLIEKDWHYLTIEELSFPPSWEMIVGWTGSPASTAKLVPRVLAYKEVNPTQFNRFLEKSTKAVKDILLGIRSKNEAQFFQGINNNREALAEIGAFANVPIETPLLYELQRIAKQYESAGKLSGAGGGDCGIAFTISPENKKKIIDAWEKVGIKYLPITFYPDGAKSVKYIE